MGFKSFWSAAKKIAGIECMYRICKRQKIARGGPHTAAEQYYSLAT